MFRVHELTHFGSARMPAAPQFPSAALAGVAWTRLDEDPLSAEIDLAALGYRSRSKKRH